MTGSQAEQNLIGALIISPRRLHEIHNIVNGEHFGNPNMGKAFDGVVDMIGRGQPVDQITVITKWPDWNILGIDSSEVFTWANANVYTNAIPDYARAVADDAARRGIRATIDWVGNEVNNTSFAPLDLAARAVDLLNEVRAGSSTGELQPRSLGSILDDTDEYDWVIPGLLERQDRLVITGSEGIGKSYWVRQLAIMSAAGLHPTTFQPIRPVRTLVVDAENTERQWRRAVRYLTRRSLEYGSADPRLTVNIQAGKRIDITRGSHLSEIHRLLDVYKPDMLFIGPLYKLVPKAITNDDDAAPLIVALDSLRERGVTLVMEAHAGKATDMGGERNLVPRGSAALMGWPEFGLGLRPTEDPTLVSVVRWRGDRDQRDWPKAMHRSGEWPWTPTLPME